VRGFRLVSGALIGIAALGATACGPEDETDTPDTAPPAQLQVAWTAKDVKPIGQPIAAGDVAVVYEIRGKRLWLTALDAVTGDVRWSREATPSWTTPGVSLEPEAVGPENRPLVAMLERNDGGELLADLVVLDPESGETVQKISAQRFRSTPSACPDSENVCVSVADADTGKTVPKQLDLSSGAFTTVPVPSGWSPRSIGSHGLVDNGLRAPQQEAIALLRDGNVEWRHTVSALFGPGATTDNGWSFHYSPTADVYVGSVGVPYRGSFTDRDTDLERYWTVGLDGSTGKVLWTDKGSSAFCSPFSDTDEDSEIFVRCRQSGRQQLRLTDNGDVSATHTKLRSTVEGLDPRTGKTTWSVDMGSSDMLYGSDVKLPMASPTAIALKTADGTQVVDFASGDLETAVASQVFVCTNDESFKYAEAVYLNGNPLYEHSGGQIASLCDMTGAASGGDFTDDLADVTGASFDDTIVLATGNGLVAYER
jgi:hypothetical protein